jgi:hypothetical protein
MKNIVFIFITIFISFNSFAQINIVMPSIQIESDAEDEIVEEIIQQLNYFFVESSLGVDIVETRENIGESWLANNNWIQGYNLLIEGIELEGGALALFVEYKFFGPVYEDLNKYTSGGFEYVVSRRDIPYIASSIVYVYEDILKHIKPELREEFLSYLN